MALSSFLRCAEGCAVKVRDSGAAVRATRGVAILSAVSLFAKIIAMAGQLVLAYLLQPADYGLFSICLTITTIGGLIAGAGVTQVLISRRKTMRLWTSAAFGLTLSSGFAIFFVVLALATPLARLLNEPQLGPLIRLSAFVLPITALGAVPFAQLQANLQFAQVAGITALGVVLVFIAQVTLASLGMGPYSLVIPLVLNSLFCTVLFWKASPPQDLRLGAMFSNWRAIFSRSSWALIVALLAAVWGYGDYFALALAFDKQTIGYYFFAFNLATVVMGILTQNITTVLVPTLVRFNRDPARIFDIFNRAAVAVAFLGIPLCVAQALLAEPFFKIMFNGKWDGSIIPFALLSLGMAWRTVGSPAGAIMQSVGQFRYQARIMSHLALLFVVLLSVGVWLGRVETVALAVMIFYTVVGPYNIHAAYRLIGIDLRHAWRPFVKPTVIAAISAVLAVGAGMLTQTLWMQGIVRAVVFAAVFLCGSLIFGKQEIEQSRSILKKIRGVSDEA